PTRSPSTTRPSELLWWCAAAHCRDHLCAWPEYQVALAADAVIDVLIPGTLATFPLVWSPLQSPGSWHAFGDGIQIEGQMRLGLVPVRHRRVVVAALVRMPVLDTDPNRSLERHGIFDMESVKADLPAPVVATRQGDAVIRRMVGLCRAPCSVEIVLGTGAVEGRRPRLAVDEDHVITLAVPVPLGGVAKVVNVEHATDVMPAAGRLQDGVVRFPVEILS